MPITLTTTYKDYSQVKVVQVRMGVERKTLHVLFQHGDTVEGAWVAGVLQPEERLIRNKAAVIDGENEVAEADPAYDVLIGSSIPGATFTDKSSDPDWVKLTLTHPTHGDLDMWVQLTYVAVAGNLYQDAIDQGWYVGVVS